MLNKYKRNLFAFYTFVGKYILKIKEKCFTKRAEILNFLAKVGPYKMGTFMSLIILKR